MSKVQDQALAMIMAQMTQMEARIQSLASPVVAPVKALQATKKAKAVVKVGLGIAYKPVKAKTAKAVKEPFGECDSIEFALSDDLTIRLTIMPKGGLLTEQNPGKQRWGKGQFAYGEWVELMDAYIRSPLRIEHMAWFYANGGKRSPAAK